MCDDGNEIPPHQVCDWIDDCSKGEDELSCDGPPGALDGMYF